MTCRQCQRRLGSYLDTVLETDARSEVLAHLAQCSACAERLHQLENNRQLLHILPTAEVTRGMELLLQSRIQNLESRVRGREPANVRSSQSAIRSWWRGWGMISAGTLATCAASFVVYFSTMHAPPPVSAEEVVASMDELITTLDSDDEMRVIGEETEDEAEPNWQDDLDPWPVGEGIE